MQFFVGCNFFDGSAYTWNDRWGVPLHASGQAQMSTERVGDRPTSWAAATSSSGDGGAREALTFLLSEDGAFLGERWLVDGRWWLKA